MTTVIPVKFAYAARDLWFDPQESGAQEGDHVICSTERGTEIGLAVGEPHEVDDQELKRIIGKSALKPVIRIAGEQDLDRAEMLAEKGDEAMPVFRRLVSQSELDMKPVGVEYLFGGEKAVCYFAADERVDFRQLVRELSRELHERIDMRQIGVREEAAVVGGFGHCGQELCCARFGLSFEPVSIRMAKEQDLPLTSNKISGACGRLMCCLRYEFEAYRDFKGRAPKRNAVIDTPLGKAKVVEYDTPKEQLALRIESGKVIRIPLGEMIASEAAVRKSEELNCPCRPDTVVRASLEKLSSPDVQMALAELDRKNGVYLEETFDDSDLFVETKVRTKRRRRGGMEAGKERPADSAQQPSRRTRRRRGQRSTGDADQQVSKVVSTEAPAEKKSRRRRRKRSAAGAPDASAAATTAVAQDGGQTAGRREQNDSQKPKETRRRRHHRAGSEGGAAQGKAASSNGGKQQQQQQQRQRRRPGDRAGQKTQEQQRGKADGGSQDPKAEGSPKRRRRRRGGRGRGGNKQGGDQTPSTS